MDYNKIAGQSSVDMLRFRIKYHGKPGDALAWFEKVWDDVRREYGTPDPTDPHRQMAVRYPISLRVGTYRDMFKIPIGETSLVLGIGKQGKDTDYKTGFIEFNPAKCYPSEQLEYIYRFIETTPEISLELVRWDFATDYRLERSEVSLMRDKRHYTFVVSNGVTEYLGSRNKNGFVKLYDKRKELEAKGQICKEPRTRLEITIEEDGKKRDTRMDGKLIPEMEWPRAVLVPKEAPSGKDLAFAFLIEAWTGGIPLEKLLAHAHPNTRTKYRKRIMDECGAIPPSMDFEECRQNAFAWERMYGGTQKAKGGEK